MSQRVREISEFDLIGRLASALQETARQSPRIIAPIGDDGAVCAITPGEHVVVTTDTLNQHVHFRLDWTTWEDLGHKAIAVNLSDLAGMGALPLMVTVSLALNGNERVSDLEAMYRGMGKIAATYQTVVAGGDVTRSDGPLSIAVTAIGESRGKRLLRRDAARPGDLIWVTGHIGAAAAGLELELMPDSDPRKWAATAPALKRALHCPLPRWKSGRTLASIGVECGMDLSDGLSGDLHKILAASGVDAEILIGDLPIAAATLALFRDRATVLALHGGEDYELLFTAPERLGPAIMQGLDLIGVRATVIGQIQPAAGAVPRLIGVEPQGGRVQIHPHGFDHFEET
jgi:thiamine-monophosphate kinase